MSLAFGSNVDNFSPFNQEFEEELLEAYTSGSLSTDTSETVWSFTGSLFYVGTVFTTVGESRIYNQGVIEIFSSRILLVTTALL